MAGEISHTSWHSDVSRLVESGQPVSAWEAYVYGLRLWSRAGIGPAKLALPASSIHPDVLDCVAEVSTGLLRSDFLSALWIAVDRQGDSPALALKEVIRALRSAANMLGGESCGALQHDSFVKELAQSILLASRELQENNLANLLESLDAAQLRTLLLAIVQTGPEDDLHSSSILVMNSMDAPTLSRMFKLLMPILHSKDVPNRGAPLVQTIVRRLDTLHTESAFWVEHLLLVHPMVETLAADMAEVMSESRRQEVLMLAVAVYSNSTFRATPSYRHAVCTKFILSLLPYLTAETIRGDMEISLMRLCSMLLDSSDLPTRVHGMRIAEAFTKISMDGKGIEFEELRLLEQSTDSSPLNFSNYKGERLPASATISMNTPTTLESNPRSSLADGASSDSESDIEALDLGSEPRFGTEALKAPILNTRYLRDCLEMLSVPESEAAARTKHQAAMERIPEILHTAPADQKEMSVLILIQLINLPNAFNIEHFDDLRQRAAVSLLVAEPALCLPACGAALFEHEVSLGMKRVLLVWMRRAAQELAQSGGELPGSSSSSSPATLAANLLAGDQGTATLTDSVVRSGKTTVRKPETLRVKAKPHSKLANQFNAVAADAFYPVARFLTLQSRDGSGLNSKFTGIDAILPTEGILALCTFLQCALYSVHIRKFAAMALDLARLFRKAEEVSIQRAVLCLVYTSMDCALQHDRVVSAAGHPAVPRRSNALDSLLHIAEDQGAWDEISSAGSEGGLSLSQELVCSPAGVETIDWLVHNIERHGGDPTCRELQSAILKLCGQVVNAHDPLQPLRTSMK